MATVLIVDDETGIREGLARAVASRGHGTVAASSLAEARAAIEGQPFDCVLLDVRLRDGDGLDLLRELRAGRHRARHPRPFRSREGALRRGEPRGAHPEPARE